jgi:hypothetical protein
MPNDLRCPISHVTTRSAERIRQWSSRKFGIRLQSAKRLVAPTGSAHRSGPVLDVLTLRRQTGTTPSEQRGPAQCLTKTFSNNLLNIVFALQVIFSFLPVRSRQCTSIENDLSNVAVKVSSLTAGQREKSGAYPYLFCVGGVGVGSPCELRPSINEKLCLR